MTVKKKWLLGLIFFLGFVGFVYRSSVFRLTQNFHEVDPGKFYRSAQLTPSELEKVIDQYGIKTVISLRGAPQNSYWVPGQIEVLAKRNVKFLHFGWTSDYFPHNDDLRGYVRALKEEQYPILVHCRTGADRTGEATAIYAIDYMKQDKQEAIDEHLSFKYWHVEAFHPAKKEFVRHYQGSAWALQEYDLCSVSSLPWAEPGHCP